MRLLGRRASSGQIFRARECRSSGVSQSAPCSSDPMACKGVNYIVFSERRHHHDLVYQRSKTQIACDRYAVPSPIDCMTIISTATRA